MLWDHDDALGGFFPPGEAVTATAIRVFADWLEDHGEASAAAFLRLDLELALRPWHDVTEEDADRWLAARPAERDDLEYLLGRGILSFRREGLCLRCGCREVTCQHAGRSEYGASGVTREYGLWSLTTTSHCYRHTCPACGLTELFEVHDERAVDQDRHDSFGPGCPECSSLPRGS